MNNNTQDDTSVCMEAKNVSWYNNNTQQQSTIDWCFNVKTLNKFFLMLFKFSHYNMIHDFIY